MCSGSVSVLPRTFLAYSGFRLLGYLRIFKPKLLNITSIFEGGNLGQAALLVDLEIEMMGWENIVIMKKIMKRNNLIAI